MSDFRFTERTEYTAGRKVIKKKPANAPSGHEAFLKALEAGNAVIHVQMLSSEKPLKGTVKHSDKFTISLRVDRDDGTHQVYVLFKHAIESFWTNPADNPKSE